MKDILYGDGNSVSYSYDALGRLEEAKDASGVTKIINDALGRVLSVTDPQGRETGYEWGSMGERLRIIYPEGKEAAYGYNERGQLSALSTGNGTITYAYDPLGHLKEKVLPDGTVTRYTFTGAGQLEKISHIGKGIEEEYSYRYDKAGNKVSAEKKRQGIEADNGTFEYLYDALNRLAEVSWNGQLLRRYTYDAFENRTGQAIYSGEAKDGILDMGSREPKDPEKQISYTIDLTKQYHNVLMSEENVGGKTQTFYWDGNVAAMEEAGQDSYYLQDDLGSPMQLLDGYGEIRESYGFDEFGQSLFPDGERKAQPFGYTGYEMEEAGGLYFAQARRYDAGVGRFISKDRDRYQRCCYPNTLNQYIYCDNNPIVHIDLRGNSIEDYYPMKPDRNAAVQVTANGNTITIDAYVDITGDINTMVQGSTAHDLVVEGIERWAGTYGNVYGHKVQVEVNVYERHKSMWEGLLYVDRQKYLEIELFDSGGRAMAYPAGSTYKADHILMYTGTDKGNPRSAVEYRNTIAHEFGHVLDIDDGYGEGNGPEDRPEADMLKDNDMMLNNHHAKAAISDIDIQMMIMATVTKEWQYFMEYSEHTQSKGVFIYEMCTTV